MFSEQLSKLLAGLQKQSQDEIYGARVEIARIVKAGVSKLTIASAGTPPPSSQLVGPIRRNHPKRCFSAVFADGSLRTGYPTIPAPVRPIRKFDSVEVSKLLRLSPRQGALTALLAEGDSLTIASEKMGMTLATARWHLREIFKRTETHSQIDLVSLTEMTCPPEVL
jgi:DNA-binding CsgD family transcriptional regulator